MRSRKRENWHRLQIGEFADVQSGGTPSRGETQYWQNGSIPWVATAEVNYRLITSTKECISQQGLQNSSAKVFPAGTLLMAMYGQGKTRGQVARLGINAATNQACAAIFPDDRVTVEYLYTYLQYSYDDLRKLSNIGGQENLSKGLIESFDVIFPLCHVQQRRIAEILRTWDEAIEKADRLIAAKEKRFKQWRDELTWSKRGELISLGDVLTQSSVRVGPGRDLRVFSVTKDGLVPQDEHFNKRISNEDVSRHMLLEPSNFALSGLNFWLGSVDVSLEADPVCISPDYKVFKIGSAAVPGFFRHLVRTDHFRQILIGCAVERASVVRKNFDRETFLASEIPLPDQKRQEAVLHALSAAEQELVLHIRQRDALFNQKRGLMQKLLTGEWPVAVPKSQEAAE